MSGRTRVSEGGTRSSRREYLCNASMVLGASHGARPCWMTVPADTIERPIIDTITSTLVAAGEPRERQKVLRELTRQTTPPSDETSTLIDGLETARTKTQARLDTLTNMRADREIDAAQYTRSTAQAIEELDRISAELKTLRARTPTAVPIGPLDAILGSCSAWARVFAAADASAVREVLGRLLESVSPVRLGRGVYEPNYAWTPTGWLVIQAALVVLAGRRGERARYESLVRVDSLARAQQSTLTMAPAALLA